MSDLIRRQMRRTGLHHALSPVLDVALDPRWGRVHETFGEDPYLCAALGVAYVRGLQGDDLSHGVMATGKHFLGYAVTQGGLNTAAFEAGSRSTGICSPTRSRRRIRMAGLRSVMNFLRRCRRHPGRRVAGGPAGPAPGHPGFDGFVSSDYGTIDKSSATRGSPKTRLLAVGLPSRRDSTSRCRSSSATATS